eukprot:g1918.t1
MSAEYSWKGSAATLSQATRVSDSSRAPQSPLYGHRSSIAAVKVHQRLARSIGGASGPSPGRGSDLMLSSTLARKKAQRANARRARTAAPESQSSSSKRAMARASRGLISERASPEMRAQVQFALTRSPGARSKLNPPPKCGAWKERAVAPHNLSRFPMFYNVGLIPCMIEHGPTGNKLQWKTPLSELNMNKFLPMFFDGVKVKEHPYNFVATTGVTDMLAYIHDRQAGARVLGCLGDLVHHMRVTINTRERELILLVLRCLRSLLDSGPEVGVALTPYYRRLLPVLNMYWRCHRNLGDRTDYAQGKEDDIGVMIQTTVEMMERNGSPDASMWIKYHIPVYESVMR